MKVPFASLRPVEKKCDKDIRAAFNRTFERSCYIGGPEDESFEHAFAKYSGSNACFC